MRLWVSQRRWDTCHKPRRAIIVGKIRDCEARRYRSLHTVPAFALLPDLLFPLDYNLYRICKIEDNTFCRDSGIWESKSNYTRLIVRVAIATFQHLSHCCWSMVVARTTDLEKTQVHSHKCPVFHGQPSVCDPIRQGSSTCIPCLRSCRWGLQSYSPRVKESFGIELNHPRLLSFPNFISHKIPTSWNE